MSLESLKPALATAASADRFSIVLSRLRRRRLRDELETPERSNRTA